MPAPEYSSFSEFVKRFAIPLSEADPQAERLDGQAVGTEPNRDTVAIFRHVGRRWELHGDTRLESVRVAHRAASQGRDPFVVGATKKGTPALRLTDDLKALTSNAKFDYFYAYEI